MDLRAYLTILRHSWLLLAVPVLVALIGTAGWLSVQTPKYTATANVFVSVGNATNVSDLSQGVSFAESAAANYASLAQQPYVLQGVRTGLKNSMSIDAITKELSTTVQESTSIIEIDVLDSSASRAATIANLTAQQLSKAVSKLQSGKSGDVQVTVVRSATAPTAATTPNKPLGLAVGLLAGLLIGVLLVILRELLDTRLHSAEELEEITGAPTVGSIARSQRVGSRPLVMMDDRRSATAEGFRSLQVNLEYLRATGDVQVIAMTSALSSEGKSTVAANLALALARAGHRVVLVDADLRRPRLHTMFGVDNGVGLTDVLIGRAHIDQATQRWGGKDGSVLLLTAGATPPNPGELLQSTRFRASLDHLAADADIVLVDGPPLLAVADSAVLARTADAVMLMASVRESHRNQVARAVHILESVGARVLGVVATMTTATRAESDAYRSYTSEEQPQAIVTNPRPATATPMRVPPPPSRNTAARALLAAARASNKR